MTAALPVAMPRIDSVFKPALLLMCGRTLAFAATFFIPVVVARVFDPAHFATYKQLFLIYSTVYLISQAGMASSLYYFLPMAPRDAGRYVANSLVFLAAAGLLGFGAVLLMRAQLAHWLSNAEVPRYIVWIGLYTLLSMLSATLEIVLISRGRYLWASASYAISDLARAVVAIVPVLLFHQLDLLLKGFVLVAFLRAAITLFYFHVEFRETFRLDRILLKNQVTYALPFALAIIVEILQASLPQYVVAYLSSPAAFAIFAVGCLSIPLVEFASSPACDVMMIRMQENLAAGRNQAVLEIWHDTTRKLALLFFPLVALVVVAAKDIILLLFTARYAASIPLFMVWSILILLSTLQVDGVLRVFAQTRFILALNLMRLAIIAGLMHWSLSKLGLIGPVLVIVLATVAFKVAALLRMRRLLEVRAVDLLPWRNLAALLGASAGAAVLAFAIRSQLDAPALALLIALTAIHASVYALLVWRFELLTSTERLAIAAWIRRTFGSVTRIATFRKG